VNRLKVASFTVHADARQSARWKIAAEGEGYESVGRWLAAAADSYLRARARAGAPVPLAWRRGRFLARLESGEELTVRGHVSLPFATFRGTDSGPSSTRHRHVLVFVPDRRVLAVLETRREARALAAELARQWFRGDCAEPATDPLAAVESLRRRGVLP
jgi:hypothetical protein